jgi:outer membrane protein assembly factor BamB
MAFKVADGELAWKTQDFGIDHSSPILVTVAGKDQVVQVTPEALFGVDPTSGELVWTETLDRADGFMVTPVWIDSQHLFYSTPSNGSRTLSLSSRDGKVVSEGIWESRKLRMTFTNPVVVGDYIIGANGREPTLIVCLDRQTGKRVWAERGFALASFVASGDRVVILEQSGRLSLATVGRKGLQMHSQFKVAEPDCYTTPTLVDTTLYLRNREEIMALDLS